MINPRTALMGILPVAILALGGLLAKALIDSYEEPTPQPLVVEPPLVRVIPAEPESLTLIVSTEGTVAPRSEAQLIPEVSGMVVEISPALVPGGFFAKDEVLLQVDPRDYELAITQALAAVEQGKLRLALEQQQAEVAKAEWEEAGEGEPSPLLFREPQIAEAKAGLVAAEAVLEQARDNLERTALRAPFAGRVRSKQVDLGQFVQRGMNLGQVYPIDVAEVRLPIPNAELQYCNLPLGFRDADSAPPGPRVRLTARFGGEDYAWDGRIARTEGEIDPRTRMINAIAQIEDPYGRERGSAHPPLAVGMFVRAEIQGKRVRDMVRLPRSVLRGEDTVYVVEGDGTLRFRTIDVFRSERETVLIRDGLESGERVCTSPLEAAVDGMRVRIMDEGPTSGA